MLLLLLLLVCCKEGAIGRAWRREYLVAAAWGTVRVDCRGVVARCLMVVVGACVRGAKGFGG